MPNIYSAPGGESHGPSGSKVGREAGAEHLGLSVYSLSPGEGVGFHYHLQREELLVVVSGTPSLRTAEGWRELKEGEVVSFPRGSEGAHGYENRSGQLAIIVVFCEQNAPNISVYPDTGEIGIFDASIRNSARSARGSRSPTRSRDMVALTP